MNKLQVMQTENRSKNTFSYPAFNFSNYNVTINYQQYLIHTEISTYWTNTCYMYISSEKLQKKMWFVHLVFVIKVTFIMLHCKFCYFYHNVEFECGFLLCLEWDVMY